MLQASFQIFCVDLDMISDAFCEKDDTVSWSHAIPNKEPLSTTRQLNSEANNCAALFVDY